ncbi:MAG: sll0787 family AIR synthase-like protein [Verrucomicrobiota bacterium]
MPSEQLAELCDYLRTHPAVVEKAVIRQSYHDAAQTSGSIKLGDDTAAIPDGEEWLLMAGEAMLPNFISKEPWFAGYCAVMANVSDIAAMGGRPLAIVDMIWKSDESLAETLWTGMKAASQRYQVPIVGGHTSNCAPTTLLGASILGKAKRLLTSFDARPGDELLMAVDLRGAWYGDNPFWNASTTADEEQLRGDIELLPQIAEARLSNAAKDISNGGIFGTLMMLLECSNVGAQVDIDSIPRPDRCPLTHWSTAFPSFGYLITCLPENRHPIIERFNARGLSCESVGVITAERALVLSDGDDSTTIWRENEIV